MPQGKLNEVHAVALWPRAQGRAEDTQQVEADRGEPRLSGDTHNDQGLDARSQVYDIQGNVTSTKGWSAEYVGVTRRASNGDIFSE